ncbi:MAG: amidohydrolase family protein, partial [Gammaproteobacteria bacterium]|nr:amidohydrolase family protein [Gammaproteobacteria bacterium]
FIRTLPLVISRPGQPVQAEDTWVIEPVQPTQPLKLPLSWRPVVPEGRLVIRAGRVFDGIGPGYMTQQDIIIERDKIIAIRPWQDPEPGITYIDASDKTVIPGFLDLAVEADLVDMERTGRKWLASGVTTIRQSTANPEQLLERLESWQSGKRIGPRLMLSVKVCATNSQASALLSTKALISRAAELQLVALELCGNTDPDELRQIIEIAHSQGIAVITPNPIPGLMLGADELRLAADSPRLSRDFLMISGKAGATMTSRLGIANRTNAASIENLTTAWQYTQLFSPADRIRYQHFWKPDTPIATRGQSNAPDPNILLGLGGQVVIGSDAPRSPHGLGVQAELRLLADNGVQPFQILKMASYDGARAMGLEQSTGLIEAGYRADLVIVEGDPLVDITAATRISGTVAGGRYFSKKTLSTQGPRGLPSVEKLYTSKPR